MGSKLVYDSSCRYTDKTSLMDEYEIPSPGMPETINSKIPIGVYNRIFADIPWSYPINRTRFRDLNTYLEDIVDFKLYTESYDGGILVIRTKCKKDGKDKSYEWAFFM